jgi:hypothetical protein
MTTKKTATANLSAEWFDVPRGEGGGGRAPGRARASILSNGKGSKSLALRADDETSAAMADWHFVTPRMRANESGVIAAVMLIKSERGLSVRRYKGQRPQVHILLTGLIVTVVEGVVGTTTSRVESNGSVVFALPEVIEGKRESFKISKLPQEVQ